MQRTALGWAAAAVVATLAVAESIAPSGSPVDFVATEPIAVVQAPAQAAPGGVQTTPLPTPRDSAAAGILDVRSERIRELALKAQEQLDTLRTSPPDPRRPHLRRPPEVSSATAVKLLEAGNLLHHDDAGIDVAGVTHTRYRMTKQGLPVFNAAGIVSERDGVLIGRSGRIQFPPLSRRASVVAKDAAVEAAMRAASIEVTRGFPVTEQGWFALAGETAPVWKVTVPAQEPFGTWQMIVDGRTGEVLSIVDLVLNVTGVGSVYDPNVALSPTPSDVPLFRLDGSGRLQGDIVRVFDARAPAAFSPGDAFRFPEADSRFGQTAVYRGVTDTGIFAENNGFPSFTESLIAYTNLADPLTSGEYNNAYYDPFLQLLGFGNGDGVVTSNLGTDFDVASHEAGHHFFQVLVQPDVFSALDPILAINEGVADTVAAVVTGDPNIGESTIPGQPYLRTLLNTASFPDLLGSEPHEAGRVYGGANWEIVQLLDQPPGTGADTFTQLLFAALAQLPPDAFPFEYRDALLQANIDTRGGADQAQIEAIFTGRGFESTEFPPEFAGIIEDSVPESRMLTDSPDDPDVFNWNFDFFVFSEFPGSTNITINSTGTGDVDLAVVSYDNQNAPAAFAMNPGSAEQIVLNSSTSPSVDDGDFWAIFVFDFPDSSPSSYTLTVTQTLPPANVVIDGAPVQGNIDVAGAFEFFTFETSSPNQVVRLEVEALADTLDPLAGILDPITFDVYGVDDDSGPGFDSEIQGALIPNVGQYSIVVLSITADIDPTIGTGAFEIRLTNCDNSSGPNSDADALVDACDDDDDNDTFVDSQDSAPLNASLCSDFDLDGCDDCFSGGFDPFNDGLDSDGDALCDLGDSDDDNDGCEDVVDPAPLVPSADPDFDFLGTDCDNCPAVANENQEDADADDVGNACDNCPNFSNSGQSDTGGVGFGSAPDGIGDDCQCGDVNGSGNVTTADALIVRRSLLVPPTATMGRSDLCDVGGSAACSTADSLIMRRALLVPPTAGITQQCGPAVP